MRSRPKARAVAVWALLLCAPAARAQLPKAGAAPATIAVAQRRAQLQGALDKLRALEKRAGKRDVTPIFRALDKNQIVRRADGATQSAKGNRWSALAAGTSGEFSDVSALQKSQLQILERDVELEIEALDAWSARPPYQAVDADAIVAQLAKSGQIRVGPTWWQAQLAAFWKRIGDALAAFWDWLQSLFPASAPRASTGAAPNLSWLIGFFWVAVVALLGYLVFLVCRAFAGNVRWGRRAKKSGDDEPSGGDEELLRLPPDELCERASDFAAAGNFREAVRHRFIALLLRLDASGFWRYDARRTNWEHIAALRRQSQDQTQNGGMAAPLASLTRRFDRVRYGGAACDESAWQRFDDDAAQLENQAGARRETAGATR